MSSNDTETPAERRLLVAVADIAGFSNLARTKSDRELFDFLSDFCERIGRLVDEGGGETVKFMGDAALVVFPADKADEGVETLRRMKRDIDGWLAEQAPRCRLQVKAHVGPAVRGPSVPAAPSAST